MRLLNFLTLNKRFYNNFAYGLFPRINIYQQKKAYIVMKSQNAIKIFDSIKWIDFPVYEEGKPHSKSYFTKQNEKKQFSWSKCIKVNETDLYVIWGI